jgi:hypothetical protein
LIGIANDANISPSVRDSAVRVMGSEATPIGASRFKDFLRDNAFDDSSSLRLSSLIQLIKISDPADLNRIVRELEGGDTGHTYAVIQAIRATEWKGGRNALANLVARENTLPGLRDIAQEVLAKVDERMSQTATPPARVRTTDEMLAEYMRTARQQGPLLTRLYFEGTGRPASQRLTLSGALKEAQADLNVSQLPNGVTKLRIKFRNLKSADGANNYVLWAASADDRVVRLGQVVDTGQPREALIESELSLKNFRLFITAEKTDAVTQPTGSIVALVPQQASPPQ